MRLKRFVQMMLDLRLDAMATTYQAISKTPGFTDRTVESVLEEIVKAQWDTAQQRRLDRELNKSNIPCTTAHIQTIDFDLSRKLNRDYFVRISSCEWVASQNNVIFTGPSRVGKKWLASAIVREALIMGYSALCYSVSDLLETFMLKRQQPIKGTRSELMKFRQTLQKVDVLMLIGLGQSGLTQAQCEDLDLVIRLRQQHGAMIVTSPLKTKSWYKYFGNTPASDAICSNLLENAHCFELTLPAKNEPEEAVNE